MSPIESLHTEAYDPPIELKKNELGFGFLCKLRSKTTYTEFPNTPNDKEDQTIKKTKKQPNQHE